MLRNNLRFRIVLSFCLFGILIGLSYSVILVLSQTWLEDSLFERRLEMETEEYLKQLAADPRAPLPYSRFIKGYLDVNAMPADIRLLAQDLKTGYHEAVEEDFHIAVQKVPGTHQTLYMVYNVKLLEIHPFAIAKMIHLTLLMLFLFMGIGIFFGVSISRMVISPVVKLARLVHTNKVSSPSNLPVQEFSDDEVGILAKSIHQYIDRIHHFLDREKRFTREASHELRTPVTVIKGALTLLKNDSELSIDRKGKLLDRIDRAVKDMESNIETFLVLAREENREQGQEKDHDDGPSKNFEMVDVRSSIENVLAMNQYLLDVKPDVQIDLNYNATPVIRTSGSAFNIAVSNLVRNAIQHTHHGRVSISLEEDRLIVSDTGLRSNPPDLQSVIEPFEKGDSSTGFGIGLSIVERLCKRFGWSFTMNHANGQGFSVELVFL
jgi:signal transduction histidine kinase